MRGMSTLAAEAAASKAMPNSTGGLARTNTSEVDRVTSVEVCVAVNLVGLVVVRVAVVDATPVVVVMVWRDD